VAFDTYDSAVRRQHNVTQSSTGMIWRKIERRNTVAGRPKKQDSQKTTGKKGSERSK
jgi:hypothetical protein